jgi:hypothetical protein
VITYQSSRSKVSSSHSKEKVKIITLFTGYKNEIPPALKGIS